LCFNEEARGYAELKENKEYHNSGKINITTKYTEVASQVVVSPLCTVTPLAPKLTGANSVQV